MITAIMQPTYLPWSGYFNLIASVHAFVFLDDVQFEKQSWQTRNRILVNGDECKLTMPVRRDSLHTLIKDVDINDDGRWRQKQLTTITQAYDKAPFGSSVIDLIGEIIQDETLNTISLMNIALIKNVSNYLAIDDVDFHLASELQVGGRRTDHLIKILNALSASQYLSPQGSKDYLMQDGFENMTDIILDFQQYDPANYPQYKRATFLSHLSIVDVIANLDRQNCIKYVRGHYE